MAIRISKDQIAALSAEGEARFRFLLSKLIEEVFSVPDPGIDQMDREIETALTDAKAFGLTSQRALATYSVVAYACGHGIKDDPRVRSVLTSTTLSEPNKADWLGNWFVAIAETLEGRA